MAEYTGHRELDQAIADFITHGTYANDYDKSTNLPLQQLRQAQHSRFMCQDLSEQFLAFVESKHPTVSANMLRDADPAMFGLPDPELIPHTVPRLFPVARNSGTYFTVDFTASQYDETAAFPLVCKFTA